MYIIAYLYIERSMSEAFLRTRLSLLHSRFFFFGSFTLRWQNQFNDLILRSVFCTYHALMPFYHPPVICNNVVSGVYVCAFFFLFIPQMGFVAFVFFFTLCIIYKDL